MVQNQSAPGVDIKLELNNYIRSRFLLEDDSKNLGDDDSFLENGIIDSTGVLELVNHIEEKFKIEVEDEELVPDNLDSLNKLTSYISRKM
jgi:acyl carrier protein